MWVIEGKRILEKKVDTHTAPIISALYAQLQYIYNVNWSN